MSDALPDIPTAGQPVTATRVSRVLAIAMLDDVHVVGWTLTPMPAPEGKTGEWRAAYLETVRFMMPLEASAALAHLIAKQLPLELFNGVLAELQAHAATLARATNGPAAIAN